MASDTARYDGVASKRRGTWRDFNPPARASYCPKPSRALRAGDLPDARETDNPCLRRKPPDGRLRQSPKHHGVFEASDDVGCATEYRQHAGHLGIGHLSVAYWDPHLQRRKSDRIPVIDAQLPASTMARPCDAVLSRRRCTEISGCPALVSLNAAAIRALRRDNCPERHTKYLASERNPRPPGVDRIKAGRSPPRGRALLPPE